METTRIGVIVGIYLVGIIFNAGGFVWLAFNHFKTVSRRLEKLELEMAAVRLELAVLTSQIRRFLHDNDRPAR